MWILWYFFIEYTIAGKTLLAYTNLFSPNDSLKNKKIYKSTLKTNITKKNVSLDFRLKKIDETMNYFLEEIKHIKSVQNFKLLWTFSIFYFCHHTFYFFLFMCFNFCICVISWCSFRYCEFFSSIKNLCINYRNKNVSFIIIKKKKKKEISTTVQCC